MIRYRLQCAAEHVFEAWFRNSSDCENQIARGQLSCPNCGSQDISKTLMAPSIASNGYGAPNVTANAERERLRSEITRVMQEIRRKVEAKADYVGPRFAEEARKIHYEEVPARGIYGEATSEEVKELSEEGITFLPLPRLPEEAN